MRKSYDVAIVGAGPAGLIAGIEAARGGASVLMVEKDQRVGYPLNCAEGVTKLTIEPALELKDEWIRAHPTRGKLISPSGLVFELHHLNGGYILDRPRMEQDLADEFVRLGGELATECRGERLVANGTRFQDIELVAAEDCRLTVSAQVFIAADGVEGTISRLAGIDNRLNLEETDAYLQYHLDGVDFDPNTLEVYVGSEIAPGSYAWVFPRGNGSVTVGTGVNCANASSGAARAHLEAFVKKRFGCGRITHTSCGTSPRYSGDAKLVLRNLLVVGDAARVLDSLTGAGIANALLSGKIAGRAAAEFVSGRVRTMAEMQAVYPGEFLEMKKAELSRLLDIKRFFAKLSDDELDDVVGGLSEYFCGRPVESISILATLAGVVKARPRILRIARHLL